MYQKFSLKFTIDNKKLLSISLVIVMLLSSFGSAMFAASKEKNGTQDLLPESVVHSQGVISQIGNISVQLISSESTIQLGQSVIFNVMASGGTLPRNYFWYFETASNGQTFSGTDQYTYTPTSAGDWRVYVYVTDSTGDYGWSNQATVVALAAPPSSVGDIAAIVENGSQNPIWGAWVNMTSAPTGQALLHGISDFTGAVIFSNVIPGSYTLHVSAKYYSSQNWFYSASGGVVQGASGELDSTNSTIWFFISGTDTTAVGTAAVIDSNSYPVWQLVSGLEFSWQPGSSHSFAWNNVLSQGSPEEFVWSYSTGLNTNEQGTLVAPLSGGGSITAYYNTLDKITFSVNPAGSGMLEMSGVGTGTSSTTSSTSYYYNQNSNVSIDAIPSSGYRFNSWSATSGISIGNFSSSTTYAIAGKVGTITATFSPGAPTGNLNVQVFNYDGNLATTLKGTTIVYLYYYSNYTVLTSQAVNTNSEVTFSSLAAGAYIIEVYHLPNVFYNYKEFWGANIVNVTSGSTTSFNFTRHTPITVYIVPNTSTITIGQSVYVNVTVKNIETYSVSVYVNALFNLSGSSTPAYNQNSTSYTIASGSTHTFLFEFTPTSVGKYFDYIVTHSEYDNNYTVTDQDVWTQFLTVSSVARNVEYNVTFKESGILSGLTWFVNLSNGQSFSSTNYSIKFAEPNGSYYYTVPSIGGYNATPPYGNFTVSGSGITVQVTFSMTKRVSSYSVNFTEVGLPYGDKWFLNVSNLNSNFSTGNIIGLELPNGTYIYSLATSDPRYAASPSFGDFLIQGSGLSRTVHFYPSPVSLNTAGKSEPAPMGIADYGIGPTGNAYQYNTTSFLGIVEMTSLKTYNSSRVGPDMSFQLNVNLLIIDGNSQYVYWIQDVAFYNTNTGEISFLDNIWNFSSPTASMSNSTVDGGGTVTEFDGSHYYYDWASSGDSGNNVTLSLPTTFYMRINATTSNGGLPVVSLQYNDGYGWITYDIVSYVFVTHSSEPPRFTVNGHVNNPYGTYYDSELIMGGPGGRSNTSDMNSNVQLSLEYFNGYNYQEISNAYNFGSDTAEGIENTSLVGSYYNSDGYLFSNVSSGSGTFGQLWTSSEVATVLVNSGAGNGILYVNKNAVSFTGGVANITVFPGIYNLSIYQGSALWGYKVVTVSAGQLLTIDIEKVYTVSFTESGLTSGLWYLNLSTTGETYSAPYTKTYITFDEPNSTYYFTISATNGEKASVSSDYFVVSGYAVSISLTFAPVQYNITFVESGLPSGTYWSVAVNNTQKGIVGNSITFSEPNGTYYYSLGVVPGYLPSLTNGHVTVRGSNPTPITVNFTSKMYLVSFSETGLPAGTYWYINISGQNTLRINSMGTDTSLQNGTYNYSIASGNNSYKPFPSSGQIIVNGASITRSVVFSLVSYNVTFIETGLKPGTGWAVSLNGNLITESTDQINFNEPNGTYKYMVENLTGYIATPYKGWVNVSGSYVQISIGFKERIQASSTVTFDERGLPPGVQWYVYLNGTSAGGTGSTITFQGIDNGTHNYSVRYVINYIATPASGNVTILGQNRSVNVTFNSVTFSLSTTNGSMSYYFYFNASSMIFSQMVSEYPGISLLPQAMYLDEYVKNPSGYPIYSISILNSKGWNVTGQLRQNLLQSVLLWGVVYGDNNFGGMNSGYYSDMQNSYYQFFTNVSNNMWKQQAGLDLLGFVNLPSTIIQYLEVTLGISVATQISNLVVLFSDILQGGAYLEDAMSQSQANNVINALESNGLISNSSYTPFQAISVVLNDLNGFESAMIQMYPNVYGETMSNGATSYAAEFMSHFQEGFLSEAIGKEFAYLTADRVVYLAFQGLYSTQIETIYLGTISISQIAENSLIAGIRGGIITALGYICAGILEQNIPELTQEEIYLEQALIPMFAILGNYISSLTTSSGHVANLTAAGGTEVATSMLAAFASDWFSTDYNMTAEEYLRNLFFEQNAQEEESQDLSNAISLASDISSSNSILQSIATDVTSLVAGNDPAGSSQPMEASTPKFTPIIEEFPQTGIVAFDLNRVNSTFSIQLQNRSLNLANGEFSTSYSYSIFLQSNDMSRIVLFGSPSSNYYIRTNETSVVTVLQLSQSGAINVSSASLGRASITTFSLANSSFGTITANTGNNEIGFKVIGYSGQWSILFNSTLFSSSSNGTIEPFVNLGNATINYYVIAPKGYQVLNSTGTIIPHGNTTITLRFTKVVRVGPIIFPQSWILWITAGIVVLIVVLIAAIGRVFKVHRERYQKSKNMEKRS